MAQITYQLDDVTIVTVLGEPQEDRYALREDGGLVKRLLQWRLGEGIHPARTFITGPGIHVAAYGRESAQRLAAWLEEQGARKKAP